MRNDALTVLLLNVKIVVYAKDKYVAVQALRASLQCQTLLHTDGYTLHFDPWSAS